MLISATWPGEDKQINLWDQLDTFSKLAMFTTFKLYLLFHLFAANKFFLLEISESWKLDIGVWLSGEFHSPIWNFSQKFIRGKSQSPKAISNWEKVTELDLLW